MMHLTSSDAADEGCMRKILRAAVRPYYPHGLFPYSSALFRHYACCSDILIIPEIMPA